MAAKPLLLLTGVGYYRAIRQEVPMFRAVAGLSFLILLTGCVSVERPIPTTAHESTAADYPAESVRLHEQGATRLRYLIDTDGNVQSVEILDSSGYSRLDEASVTMVKKRWRFWPALRNGKPVEVWMPARIVWELRDKPQQ